MPAPVLDDLKAQIAVNTSVVGGAIVLVNGINARIQSAVDKAIANGATAEELAPITDEIAAMKADDDALAAAVLANTPSATP